MQHLHLHGHGATYNETQSALPPQRRLRGSSLQRSRTVWRTANRQLIYKDKAFFLKGISWNGVESDCRCVHGLWKHDIDFYLGILQREKFNGLRVPVSYELMNDLTQPVKYGCAPYLADMQVGDFLKMLLDKAWDRGIVTVFDLHTIGGEITTYPWTDTVSEDQVVHAWLTFADRFVDHPGLMGFEIKNEPHGDITLDMFFQHVVRVTKALLDCLGSRFQGLIFVDGVQGPGDPWGGTLGSTSIQSLEHPNVLCQLKTMYDRYVFSPHVYGPDVRSSDVAGEGVAEHERRFGFITGMKNHWGQSAVVPTEFGGHLYEGTGDLAYFQRWRDWMYEKGFRAGGFWWTFPETSRDTGGLLIGEDWSELDPVKLEFLRSVQPHPTIL